VTRILRLLGNAEWTLNFEAAENAPVPEQQAVDDSGVSAVALFSGGLDSTCGASILTNPKRTRLVGFYTGQKTLQEELAKKLNLSPPVQWTWSPRPPKGRGVSYFYRSFLFLALAAVTAESWGARKILQFENGILALAIPPSANYRMTCHAHPKLHQFACELFSSLFGGTWKVENPFQMNTKRECYAAMADAVGKGPATELASMTQTCWAYRSPRVRGGKKRPGVSCGVCVPCIVRRTAVFQGRYKWNLRSDAPRNDTQLGAAFRTYYGLAERLLKKGRTPLDFYMLLDSEGRELLAPVGPFKLEDLHSLFRRFSNEFMDTFL
jgi:7-cyano-7-deazaguanine synthase in queuosine biosynthesis